MEFLELLKVESGADLVSITLSIYAVIQVLSRVIPTKENNQILSSVGKFLNLIFLKSNIINSKVDFLQRLIIDKALDDVIKFDEGTLRKLKKRIRYLSQNIASLANSKNKSMVEKALIGNDGLIENHLETFLNEFSNDIMNEFSKSDCKKADLLKFINQAKNAVKKIS